MVSLQSIIWVFLLNNFSRAINLLLTKLARDRTGRISALGLFVRTSLRSVRTVKTSCSVVSIPHMWRVSEPITLNLLFAPFVK